MANPGQAERETSLAACGAFVLWNVSSLLTAKTGRWGHDRTAGGRHSSLWGGPRRAERHSTGSRELSARLGIETRLSVARRRHEGRCACETVPRKSGRKKQKVPGVSQSLGSGGKGLSPHQNDHSRRCRGRRSAVRHFVKDWRATTGSGR